MKSEEDCLNADAGFAVMARVGGASRARRARRAKGACSNGTPEVQPMDRTKTLRFHDKVEWIEIEESGHDHFNFDGPLPVHQPSKVGKHVGQCDEWNGYPDSPKDLVWAHIRALMLITGDLPPCPIRPRLLYHNGRMPCYEDENECYNWDEPYYVQIDNEQKFSHYTCNHLVNWVGNNAYYLPYGADKCKKSIVKKSRKKAMKVLEETWDVYHHVGDVPGEVNKGACPNVTRTAGIRRKHEVEWVVDSGASITIVSPGDCKMKGIKTRRLCEPYPIQGVGGRMDCQHGAQMTLTELGVTTDAYVADTPFNLLSMNDLCSLGK